MYNVSDAYKTIVRSTSRNDKLTGIVTLSSGDTIDINDTTISQGGVSIAHQCIENEELQFGSAILGQLDLTLRSDIDRYAFYGAEIVLSYYVLLHRADPEIIDDEDEWEEVPLGIFTVAEADRAGTLVKLIAYDNLKILDMPFGDTVLGGKPHDVLSEVCEYTGMELGVEAADIEDWPNADQIIQIDSTNGCRTFRDAVKIVCQLIGAFAKADRFGRLVVQQYHATPDVTLTEHHRYNLTLADYTCSYRRLEVTGLAGTFISEDEEIESGLTMYMKDAAAWDYGLPETLLARADILREYLTTISYTPCELNMPGDPAFDCGDRIVLSVNGEEIETLVTEVDWSYRKSMDISSKGSNPYDNDVNGLESSISRIIQEKTEANKLTIYDFTNDAPMVVNDGDSYELYTLYFATNQTASVIFHASIIMDVMPTRQQIIQFNTNASIYNENDELVPITGSIQLPGNVDVKIHYILDSRELEYYPIEKYVDGRHTMILFYPFTALSAQTLHSLRIEIEPTGGSIRVAAHDFKGTLFGQNMSGSGQPWDGTIECIASIETMKLEPLIMYNLRDELGEIMQYEPEPIEFEETFTVLTLPALKMYNLSDDNVNVFGDWIGPGQAETMSYDTYYIKLDNNRFELQDKYKFTGVEQSIDEGNLFSIEVDLQQFDRVDNIEVKTEWTITT